jgi:heme-degrading monooxygenase HmoA
VIRTLLHLRARPGCRDALIEWFRTEQPIERSMRDADALGGEVYALEDGVTVLVTALWRSEADYASWTGDPWRQATAAEISALLETELGADQPGTVLTSVHAVPAR